LFDLASAGGSFGYLPKVLSLIVKWVGRMSQGSVITELMGAAEGFKSTADLKHVIERIKDAKVVMLGEASHGTQDYYAWRRLISQELVANHDFRFIGVEGDWPPTRRIKHFIGAETGSGRFFHSQSLQSFLHMKF
jgi:hypothetical protein